MRVTMKSARTPSQQSREARITRTVTRFLGVGAKDNSLETILSISRRRARDPAAFGALIGKC